MLHQRPDKDSKYQKVLYFRYLHDTSYITNSEEHIENSQDYCFHRNFIYDEPDPFLFFQVSAWQNFL